jgi:DNA-binding transcriptional ArsR family regulator
VAVNIDSRTTSHADPHDPHQILGASGRESRIFFALSDATRRQLLNRLLDNDGQRQAELTAGLRVSRQAAVKHLDILEKAHLITVDRVGRVVFYRLNPGPLRTAMTAWLDRFPQTRARVDCGP